MKVRFLEANFDVRKWRTNDEYLYNLINLYDKNGGVNSGVGMNNVNSINNNKVLGLYWDHKKHIISLYMKFLKTPLIVYQLSEIF